MCGREYPIEYGIPILLRDTHAATHDDIEHDPRQHKQAQANYFDRQDVADFETTRPHGTPRLHAWLLRRKFLLGTEGIRSKLPGAAALVVCGGSGMDGEFLLEAGATVITSDISLGAARRAAERARRFGLPSAFMDRNHDVSPRLMVSLHDCYHGLSPP